MNFRIHLLFVSAILDHSMVMHAVPNPGMKLFHSKPLADDKRLKIYESMNAYEKAAVAGPDKSFETAKQHICTEPGKNIVLARYEILKSLCTLHYGAIYHVVDTCDKSKWTLQKFPKSGKGDFGTLEHEVLILNQLGPHENIVSFDKTIELENFNYALLPLMQESLPSYAYAKKTLELMRTVMKQVVEAVYHAHSRNIVINGLKLESVLVESTSPLKIRLADFGLATIGETTSGRAGKEIYMPLEKRNGLKDGNYKSDDIWAIGMMMRYLLRDFDIHFNMIDQYVTGGLDKWAFQKGASKWENFLSHQFDQATSGYGQVPLANKQLLSKALNERYADEKDRLYVANLAKNIGSVDKHFPDAFKNDNQFMNFFKSCLQYDPTQRATIETLRRDPFLNDGTNS